MIVFDPEKDRRNVAKHAISLNRARELEVVVNFVDERYADGRFRAYGFIDGRFYCLAYVIRTGLVRAISLRRARKKEVRRYVEDADQS